MAGELRKVKTRIVATKKTSQITKAMNMVSASKLKVAEKSIKEYRPFIDKVKDIILNLVSSDETLEHPLLEKREIKKTCYLVIASDRGLAGAFNSNVCKELTKCIKENKLPSYVIPIGLKAYAYAKKEKFNMVEDRIINIRDDIEFSQVSSIIKTIVVNYLNFVFDEVYVIYNSYINKLVQEVKVSKILPLETKKIEDKHRLIYEFDGGASEILSTALPIYIENYVYSFILDSKASEHAARMNSMKSATDNANDVINRLELLYNRARQAAITLELTDIVGGASVVNQD